MSDVATGGVSESRQMPSSSAAAGRARTAAGTTTAMPQVQIDLLEARLEARELSRFLLAKSLFDCKEFDRCAAVFLPAVLPEGPVMPSSSAPSWKSSQVARYRSSMTKGMKGSLSFTQLDDQRGSKDKIVRLSQKALFLALYAKFMAGEKRKNEESEMILGPADGGVTVNKELNGIVMILQEWFKQSDDKSRNSQGWLEYLYGIVLSKGKNEDAAKEWLVRSLHLYSYNWGAWQELSSLIGTVEEVCSMYLFEILA